MAEELDVEVRLRRGTAAQWAAKNPILGPGEEGYETDTRLRKVGDGVTPYNDLGYSLSPGGGGGDDGAALAALQAHINNANTPHPNYDNGADLVALYENAKV